MHFFWFIFVLTLVTLYVKHSPKTPSGLSKFVNFILIQLLQNGNTSRICKLFAKPFIQYIF